MPLKFNPISGEFDLVDDLSGYVVGPASATDEAIARYDLPTGKLIQDSSVFINDSGYINGGSANTDAEQLAMLEQFRTEAKNFVQAQKDSLEAEKLKAESELTKQFNALNALDGKVSKGTKKAK